LKRLSERQTDLIKKLEERERILNQQQINFEKEHHLLNDMNTKHKHQISEYSQKQSILEIKLESTTALLEKSKQSIHDLHHQSESLLNDKERLKEQLHSSETKLAYYTSPSSVLNQSSDERLNKELENYKLLLKCSSCNIRFKTHCLSRCMHCFWYQSLLTNLTSSIECINDVLDARQRKCMACGIPFGAADVKQIFL